jgi:hypothetical protein
MKTDRRARSRGEALQRGDRCGDEVVAARSGSGGQAARSRRSGGDAVLNSYHFSTEKEETSTCWLQDTTAHRGIPGSGRAPDAARNSRRAISFVHSMRRRLLFMPSAIRSVEERIDAFDPPGDDEVYGNRIENWNSTHRRRLPVDQAGSRIAQAQQLRRQAIAMHVAGRPVRIDRSTSALRRRTRSREAGGRSGRAHSARKSRHWLSAE